MSCRLLSPTRKSLLFLFLLVLASGCGGGGSTPSTPVTPSPTEWKIEGVVTESVTGKPLENVRVEILDGPNAGRLTATDKAGVYKLWDLAQGGFTLKLLGAGYVPVLKPVTLTSDTKLDFSLVRDQAKLRIYIQPETIKVGPALEPEYQNQLKLTLYVQEMNFVDISVERIFYRFVPASGTAWTWTQEGQRLRELYGSPEVVGGTWSPFTIRLLYNGEPIGGTLTAVVDLVDRQGVTYRETATAAVEK